MFINKTFRNAFEGIFFNEPGLEKIKRLTNQGQKVVLVPIYRSFLDLSLILYTLYTNQIDFPFSFGCADDIPSAAFLDSVLSNAGYISTLRSRTQSLQ
jgi:glycerol-3-phosphate O-acyltransferase